MLPEAKTPLNGEAPPKYGLVLCEGDKLVTVGQLETRKVLFVFDINQKANSFLVRTNIIFFYSPCFMGISFFYIVETIMVASD